MTISTGPFGSTYTCGVFLRQAESPISAGKRT